MCLRDFQLRPSCSSASAFGFGEVSHEYDVSYARSPLTFFGPGVDELPRGRSAWEEACAEPSTPDQASLIIVIGTLPVQQLKEHALQVDVRGLAELAPWFALAKRHLPRDFAGTL